MYYDEPGRGRKKCPSCSHYAPNPQKMCKFPGCSHEFQRRVRVDVPKDVAAPFYMDSENSYKSLQIRNKIPLPYRQYPVFYIVDQPSGKPETPYPAAFDKRLISKWAHRIRLEYLRQGEFLTSKALIYLLQYKFPDRDCKNPIHFVSDVSPIS
jgi:hypothetical protein